jgi:signal transduction histidine kinase
MFVSQNIPRKKLCRFDDDTLLGQQLALQNKGLGLGLHTTAKIIKAHNGKISVNSKKNEYFEITLRMNLVK